MLMADNVDGVGIGLVITKYMVELRNRNLCVENTQGQESTFLININLRQKLFENKQKVSF